MENSQGKDNYNQEVERRGQEQRIPTPRDASMKNVHMLLFFVHTLVPIPSIVQNTSDHKFSELCACSVDPHMRKILSSLDQEKICLTESLRMDNAGKDDSHYDQLQINKTYKVLEEIGIADCFKSVEVLESADPLLESHSTNYNGDLEPLQNIIKKTCRKPSQILYLDVSVERIAIAKKCGLYTALVGKDTSQHNNPNFSVHIKNVAHFHIESIYQFYHILPDLWNFKQKKDVLRNSNAFENRKTKHNNLEDKQIAVTSLLLLNPEICKKKPAKLSILSHPMHPFSNHPTTEDSLPEKKKLMPSQQAINPSPLKLESLYHKNNNSAMKNLDVKCGSKCDLFDLLDDYEKKKTSKPALLEPVRDKIRKSVEMPPKLLERNELEGMKLRRSLASKIDGEVLGRPETKNESFMKSHSVLGRKKLPPLRLYEPNLNRSTSTEISTTDAMNQSSIFNSSLYSMQVKVQ